MPDPNFAPPNRETIAWQKFVPHRRGAAARDDGGNGPTFDGVNEPGPAVDFVGLTVMGLRTRAFANWAKDVIHVNWCKCIYIGPF